MTPPLGLLYSQIGYDTGGPMRALVRGPQGTLPVAGAAFDVLDGEGRVVKSGPTVYWGELWDSHWWVTDFAGLAPGRYSLAVSDGLERFRSAPFDVGPRLLWERTWRQVGLDQNERRAHLAMNKIGWQDCGAAWQEANSHAALVLGLCDLYEFALDRLSGEDRCRLGAQIRNGCDYLALLQDRAEGLGFGAGAMCHQTPKFEEYVLPRDVAQSVLAFARASRFLPDSDDAKKQEYRQRAEAAWAWLQTAKPWGAGGFSRLAHGAPADFVVPVDEWMTTDLLLMAWAAFDLSLSGPVSYREAAVSLCDEALRRQVTADRPEGAYYGHFRTFAGADFTEKAWTHHLDDGVPGADAGGHYPHWVLPLLRMREAWPDHPQAGQWEEALRDFAYGYLLPACRASPFGLAPLGYYTGQGLLWFAGLWHGMNAAYGLTAALALEFERHFADPAFREIATDNLQWIAGLNAGITAETQSGSLFFTANVPLGAALPHSLIYGIGARWAGSWLAVRGAIGNGFSTGAQFKFDVAPTVANDGPSTFTDEDWITHAGAWLSALARLS